MKKSALRFLILTGLLKVVLLDQDIFVEKYMKWSDAKKYCRKYYTDLSSVYNQENDRLNKLRRQTQKPNIWIGLCKENNSTWKWSNGRNATVFNWAKYEKKTEEQNGCVSLKKYGWKIHPCEKPFFFSCFHRSLVLVKENLTWEKALQHCRDQGRQLFSLDSEPALNQALRVISEAQTTRVWTGLRYLAGSWLWVEGGEMWYEAWGEGGTPHCPDVKHRCGAVSKEVAQWETWDCTDELNFVCH